MLRVDLDSWLQDDVKILWSMNYCMVEDPQRRFTFGFTIEDTEMRMWFCCREIVLVSEDFNFLTVSKSSGLHLVRSAR